MNLWVIFFDQTIVSTNILIFFQYFGAMSNYNSALSYLCKDQKYRMRAMDIAKSEGLYNNDSKKKKKKSKVSLLSVVSVFLNC